MILFLVLIVLLILLPAAAVLALNRLWPDTKEATLAFTAGLIPPAILGILLIVIFRDGSQQPQGPDSLVLGTIMAIGPIMVVASLAVTVPAAMITLLYLRKRTGR